MKLAQWFYVGFLCSATCNAFAETAVNDSGRLAAPLPPSTVFFLKAPKVIEYGSSLNVDFSTGKCELRLKQEVNNDIALATNTPLTLYDSSVLTSNVRVWWIPETRSVAVASVDGGEKNWVDQSDFYHQLWQSNWRSIKWASGMLVVGANIAGKTGLAEVSELGREVNALRIAGATYYLEIGAHAKIPAVMTCTTNIQTNQPEIAEGRINVKYTHVPLLQNLQRVFTVNLPAPTETVTP